MDQNKKDGKITPGQEMAKNLFILGGMGFERLMESMSLGVALHEIVTDEAGVPCDYTFLYVNPAFESMTGLKSCEITGRTVRRIFPKIEDFWISTYGRVALTGEPVSFENYTRAIDKWFEVNAYSPGKGFFACIFSEITERKKSEKELKLFKSIIDFSSEAIAVSSPDCKLVYTNQAFEKLFGISKKKAVGMDYLAFFKGDSGAYLKNVVIPDIVAGSSWNGELSATDSEGRDLKLLISLDSVRGADGLALNIFGLMHDLSAAKKIEAEKHLAEERLNSFLANIDDAVFFVSLEGHINFLNPSCFKFSGYGHDEFKEDPLLWQNLIDSDDLKDILDFIRRRPSNFGFRDLEFKSRDKNGYWRWINARVTPAFSASGDLIGYNCIGRDMTKSKRAETILRLNNRISSIFLTSEPDLLFRDVLGFVLDSFKAKIGFIAFFENPGTPVFLSAFPGNVFEICEVGGKIWEGYNICARSISERRILVKNSDLDFPEGHIIMDNAISVPIMLRDSVIAILVMANRESGFDEEDEKILNAISFNLAPVIEAHMRTSQRERERKLYAKEKECLENQFRQIQKIEAIGQLAGGMAHDLNNMLSPILGYSELILSDYPENPDIQNGVSEIRKAAERARDLVRNLLAFSRKQTLELMQEDLNYIISRIEKMLRHVIMENIRLDLVLSGYPVNIMVDAGQMEHILLNLALNAQDAMPSGGVLSVSTSIVFLDRNFLSGENSSLMPGNYALLEMRDTGSGMGQDVLTHIFEPFFTTKDVGKGTGLGLASVYGIVRQHKGLITVSSEIGRGSIFRVYLPIYDGSGGRRSAETFDDIRVCGTEAVIIVEDNEMVRFFVEHVLRRHGFNVLVADCPEKGLEVMENYPHDIHLMLTDIIMPEMNGVDLYNLSRRLKPNLKIVYMTGYGDEVISGQGLIDDGIRVIRKPFSIAELVSAVRNALDH